MDEQAHSNLGLFIIIATLLMFIMALCIIVFAVLYQQKMKRKQQELIQIELNHKNSLVQEVLDAKEKEQSRIAIELHDDIGSSLTALKLSFSSLDIDSEEKKVLNEGVQLTINKVRSLSNRLLPTVLEELGLIPAVKSLINTLSKQVTTVEFVVLAVNNPQNPGQTKDVNLAIYRILQELTNNVLKYAQATKVEVFVEQNEEGVILILEDNGIGFIPSMEDKMKVESLGLKNIESRCSQIKANLTYELLHPGTKVKLIWKAPKEL